jgi:hypothetical protein
MEAPPAALWDPGEADGSHEDEKKLRADRPAMSDYICVLKSCKKVGGAALQDPADGGPGDEKKLRADSPAISDYASILKNCTRVWGEKLMVDSWGTSIWEPLIKRKWVLA